MALERRPGEIDDAPAGKLPLSLTRTTTLLSLARLVTPHQGAKGQCQAWAAVLAWRW